MKESDQSRVVLLLVLLVIYQTGMTHTQSTEWNLCSSFEEEANDGVLTTPSYPEYKPLTRCQCQLTAMDHLNIQLHIQLHEENTDGECIPRMWVSRSQHHSFHACPSEETNSSVLLTLDKEQTIIIMLSSQADHLVRGFVQFKALPASALLKLTCGMDLNITAAWYLTHGNRGYVYHPGKAGATTGAIAAAVVLAVLAIIIVLGFYLKAKYDGKKRTKSKEKLNKSTMQVEESRGDNPAFEKNPDMSYSLPVQDGVLDGAPEVTTPSKTWTPNPPSVSPSPLYGEGQLGPLGFTNKAFGLTPSNPSHMLPQGFEPYTRQNGTNPHLIPQRPGAVRITNPRQPYQYEKPMGQGLPRSANQQPARPAPSSNNYLEKRPPDNPKNVERQPYKKKKRPKSQQQVNEQPLAPSHPPVSDNPQYRQNRPKPHLRPTAAFNVSANDIRFIDEAEDNTEKPYTMPSSIGYTRPYISSPAQSSVYGTPPESPTGLKQYRYPNRGTETMI